VRKGDFDTCARHALDLLAWTLTFPSADLQRLLA